MDGIVNCRGGFVSEGIVFKDSDDGYVNCNNTTTDLDVLVESDRATLGIGATALHTITLTNVKANPTSDALFVRSASFLTGDAEFVTPLPDNCFFTFGVTEVQCDVFDLSTNPFGRIQPGESYSVDLTVRRLGPGTITHTVEHQMSNPDADGSNDSSTVDMN